MLTRVVTGRSRVARELLAAAPLAAAVRAPAPARAPWLTAVLGLAAARPLPSRWMDRSVAVVVERDPSGPPVAAAFLALHRRGPGTTVGLLGARSPLPGGRPPSRLLARDVASAGSLAGAVVDLLGGLRGGWSLELAGLPMGDPVVRALADRLPRTVVANVRSTVLVDELDALGTPVQRGTDPRWIDARLPAVLAREPDPAVRQALRVLARVHAAAGELELAVAGAGGAPAAALLTLLDGTGRWPWWGSSDVGGLRGEMGSPLVGVSARGGWQLPQLPVPPLRPGGQRP